MKIKILFGCIVLTVLMLGFTNSAEAISVSIVDTFIDENLIALKQNVEVDTVAGQVDTNTYSWYKTYSYAGNNYAASSNYASSISWNTIIPGYSSAYNPAPNGNGGAKGQSWCNNVLITSGWENNFSDWFLPNIGELDASGLSGWSSTSWTTQRAAVNPGDYWPKGNTWGPARPARIVTAEQGLLESVNLLAGRTVYTIDSFAYDVSSLPGGTILKVQFSQDNTDWYDSSGTLNGWDTLIAGTDTISLASLSWVDPNFYYRMQFTTDGFASSTPVLDEITLNFNGEPIIPEPTSLLLLGFGVVGVALFKKRIS